MIKFPQKSNWLVSGSSQAGKSEFVLKLVTHAQQLFEPPPERFIWCYSIFNKKYEEYSKFIEFTDVVPKVNSFDGTTRTMIVLDDLMQNIDSNIEEMFTKGSHHKSPTV